MAKPTYEFAGVELDTARREIRAGGHSEQLPPLVFQCLEFLAEHAGEIVSKDEIADALWPGRTVTESSVSQVLRKARGALERSGADPSIIRRQHGHGYRLEADVAKKEGATKEARWQEHPIRTGAIVAVLGGMLVTAANISDVLSWLLPDESARMLEQTQTTVQSTDEKVDELVRLLRDQAARSGSAFDPASEGTIRDALEAIVQSADTRKQVALNKLSQGDVDGAAKSLMAVAEDLDRTSEQSVASAAAAWREAGAIYYTTDVEKAVESYDAAYRLLPDSPVSLLDLGYAHLRADRLDDALGFLEALAGMDAPADLVASAQRGVGIVFKLKGDYRQAEAWFDRAMTTAMGGDDRRQQALTLLQQGAIHRARGDNSKARKDFATAAGYAEETGDEHLLAVSLNNLGIIMAVSGNFDEAERTLVRANEIHKARFDLAGQANSLGNLGAAALSRGDADMAETYLLESVAIGEKLGWQRSIALDLINLGSIAAARDQFTLAEERLGQALQIATAIQLNEIRPIILVNLGEVARDRQDPAEACRLWHEALPALKAMQHGAAGVVENYIDDLDCPRMDPE